MRYVIILIAAFFTATAFGQDKEKDKDVILLKDSISYIGYIQKITDSTVTFSNGHGTTQKFNRADVLNMTIRSKDAQAYAPKKVEAPAVPKSPFHNLKIAGGLGIAGTTMLITGFIMTTVSARASFDKPETAKGLNDAGLAFTGIGLTMDLGAFASLFIGGKKVEKTK